MKDTKVKSDQKRNSATMLMTEGKIWKQLLVFAVPLILGNLLQQMYNAVDSIIVGNYVGSNALAAVGSSNALSNLLIAFAQGASVGAGVVISQFLGAGDTKRVHRAVHTAATIALLLGVMLTGAGIALSRVLLVAMDTPTAVLNDSVLYLRIYAGGFLFNVVYNMATGILNAAGNSRRPLLYLGAASVTNIVLDLVLIEGCKMGVAGAAVATDVSQLISCLLAVSYLLRVKSDYRIRVKSLCLDGDMARRIVRVGLPTGIQNMVISFSNVLVQTSVNHYGAMAMAGFTAYLKVDGFNILPVLSISMAVTTFVGQNYGAGNLKRVVDRPADEHRLYHTDRRAAAGVLPPGDAAVHIRQRRHSLRCVGDEILLPLLCAAGCAECAGRHCAWHRQKHTAHAHSPVFHVHLPHHLDPAGSAPL